MNRKHSEAIISLYERHAYSYDRDRGRKLQEQGWLDRFLDYVRPSGVVLDIGCGMGEPVARYIAEQGYDVVGIDSSPSMIEMCRRRFPRFEWHVADMRQIDLGRQFDGVLAWDSFFHLSTPDQRTMFPLFAAHTSIGAPLMFTSGPRGGDAVGSYHGEPLFHSSLEPTEYEQLLEQNGFSLVEFRPEDPKCGWHSVWFTRLISSPWDKRGNNSLDTDAPCPSRPLQGKGRDGLRREGQLGRWPPMAEVVRFSNEPAVFDKAERLYWQISRKLARLLPEADIHHVGGTAIPGSLTKGDLDVAVRVAQKAFSDAEQVLATLFDRNTGSSRTDGFAAFKGTETDPDLGVQLVVIGGSADNFLVWRDKLNSDLNLRRRYDDLKRRFHGRSMEAYRNAKSKFIRDELGGEQIARPGT